MWRIINGLIITRHSLVRAKGEVLVLLCFLFVRFFCQRFLDNPRADSRQFFLHAVPHVSSPLWGLGALGGGKGGNEIFVNIGVNGEFWREWRVSVSSTDALVVVIIIISTYLLTYLFTYLLTYLLLMRGRPVTVGGDTDRR